MKINKFKSDIKVGNLDSNQDNQNNSKTAVLEIIRSKV